FHGDKYGEHTRVFINSQGLPTYEAKEIGLIKNKFKKYPNLNESIVVTANEQSDYFKVIIASLKVMYPDIAVKMKHISHGILRPSSGKMSSRKGNVVSADDLISEFEVLVKEKIKDREFNKDEYNEVLNDVSISALKYTILHQAIGGDIIYDPKKAVSFEGDSGPYLQYATVRANAVIVKARENNISEKVETLPEKVDLLERLLIRFPEIIERSRLEYAPHYIVTYLIELSSAFNSYYANNQIIDKNNSLSPYRIALTKVFVQVMKSGLWILGIKVPGRM
ncbi:MAG TPA: arginine--tRNA ligase, partial [Candidatus Paceibacterota bacterium]